MIECSICNGSGRNYNLFSGDYDARDCPCCEGTGQCTREELREYLRSKREEHELQLELQLRTIDDSE